jgi:hypothetical protein
MKKLPRGIFTVALVINKLPPKNSPEYGGSINKEEAKKVSWTLFPDLR